MEIWNPDKFFPRFGHRIPNDEEVINIKANGHCQSCVCSSLDIRISKMIYKLQKLRF